MFKSLLLVVFLVAFVVIIFMVSALIVKRVIGKSVKSLLSGNKSGIEGSYRHYKGAECEVIGVATNATNEEEMVVYRKQDNGLWVRPRAEFEGYVVVNGVQVRAFVRV